MKLYNHSITYKEVPGLVSLTLAFSGCSGTCEGCHSPHLREDAGDYLTVLRMKELLDKYGKHIDVVTFLGGESTGKGVIDSILDYGLDICVYTGKDALSNTYGIRYLKTGSYVALKRGIDTVGSNQKMVDLRTGEDITYKFRK